MGKLKSLISVLFFAIFSVTAMAKKSNEEVKNIYVYFDKKTSAATYHGKVSGYGYDQYHLKAKKGQLLKIIATSDRRNSEVYLLNKELPGPVNLGSDSLSMDDNGNFVIPYSGAYQIRILQPRSFARRGEKFNYVIQMSIH